nr:MAG TPA: hypothetical protein [Caudoviricetes sp.]
MIGQKKEPSSEGIFFPVVNFNQRCFKKRTKIMTSFF